MIAMAKVARAQYVCQSCGAVSPRWVGKCPGCGEWNTLAEEVEAAQPPGLGLGKASRGRAVALQSLAEAPAERFERMTTSLAELDRVTGGGIVPGSALLIGGEPGIGKSTLLLQVAAAFALAGRRAVYFTGEEAATQVRLRAERLGLAHASVELACETSLANILATLGEGGAPHLVIVDSVQTVWADEIEAAAGTVSQVRAATQALVRFAKSRGSALLLVGHVTKDGQIAGPKVIEHMVDTVLYFEGDRGHAFRILRAAKNRFGATDEIGVFEMAASGLREVANPSELFLGERLASTPGSAVFAGMEGHVRSWSSCRRWWCRRASARRGAPSWAGTPTGSPCSSRCSTRAAGSASRNTTSTSTWRAVCGSPSPRRISQLQQRSSRRFPILRSAPMTSTSVRSASRGPSVRPGT
jgi:DNA repair protein RadA/Sms